MLLQDAEFKPLRKSLRRAGFRMVLQPSGAIVLVDPEQYLDVIACLESRALKRCNVVVAESLEYLVDEVLLRLAPKHRPRENRRDRQELDLDPALVVKRTFACSAPTR